MDGTDVKEKEDVELVPMTAVSDAETEPVNVFQPVTENTVDQTDVEEPVENVKHLLSAKVITILSQDNVTTSANLLPVLKSESWKLTSWFKDSVMLLSLDQLTLPEMKFIQEPQPTSLN